MTANAPEVDEFGFPVNESPGGGGAPSEYDPFAPDPTVPQYRNLYNEATGRVELAMIDPMTGTVLQWLGPTTAPPKPDAGPAAPRPQGALSAAELTGAGAVEVYPGVLNLNGVLYFENVDGTYSVDRSTIDLGGQQREPTILDLISNAQQVGANLGGGGAPGMGDAIVDDFGMGGGGGALAPGAPRNQFNFAQDPYTQQRTISTAEVATPGGGSQTLHPYYVAETLRSFGIEPTGNFQADLEAYYNLTGQRLIQQAQNPDLTPGQIQAVIGQINNPAMSRVRASGNPYEPGVSLGYKPAWSGASQEESDATTLASFHESLRPVDEQIQTFNRGGRVIAGRSSPRKIRRFATGGEVDVGAVWDYTQQTGDTSIMPTGMQQYYLDQFSTLTPWERYQQQHPGLSPDWGGLRDYPEMLSSGGDFTTPEEIIGVGARTGHPYFMAGEDPTRPLVNPPVPEKIEIKKIKRFANGGSGTAGEEDTRSHGVPQTFPPPRPADIEGGRGPRQQMGSYRIGNSTYIVPMGTFGQMPSRPEGAMAGGETSLPNQWRPTAGGYQAGGASRQPGMGSTTHPHQRASNAIRRFMLAPKSATYRHVGTTAG